MATLTTRVSADTEEKVEFCEILDESIAEGLKNVIGEGGMQAVLYYLDLNQNDRNPKRLNEKLEIMFKENGATVLEKVIIKELYLRLGIPYREGQPFDFEEHVNLAMQVASSKLRGRELR